jgi:phosphatidylserine/phosphatidylglycerophosphate/cardiolipin synthase-like enzyme
VLHHKYLICDFASSGGFPVTVTGSHNWSASAESINDENTVIIYDEAITNLYYQEFFQRYVEITSGVQELGFLGDLVIYPNPSTEAVRFDHAETFRVEVYNNTGVMVIEKTLQPLESLDIRSLPAGLYFVKGGAKTGRFVKL